MTGDEESRAWVDRLAVTDLIYRYSDGVNRADWDQVETVFATDAVWEIPAMGVRVEGSRAFRDFMVGQRIELLIQTPHAPVIRLLGSWQAKSTTTVHEVARMEATNESAYAEPGTQINLEQYGIYYDDLAKIDGAWRFTHRLFVPIHIRPDCVTGEVLTPRSSLMQPVSE